MGIFGPAKEKNKDLQYYFLYLKDIYGLKDIREISDDSTEEKFFKNNSITFEKYVSKKYGKEALKDLPVGIIIERKLEGPFIEINSKIIFGELSDKEANLLLYHGQYYEYGTEERHFGVEKEGLWSIYKGYLAGSSNGKRYIVDDIKDFIKDNLSFYKEDEVLKLTKYLLEFSNQTVISKEKYYENIVNADSHKKSMTLI